MTSKQFENVLGEGNVFTTSQQEYMQKVNEHLFGYSDVDNYKDLLNLLIQLRSPKLSKDFKPTVIYEILKECLNTLSDYDLRAMAETMDNMDSLNTKLEELDEEEFYKNECYFQHGENLKNIINEKEEYDINYILESVNEHDNLVRSAYNLIVEYESKNNELNHYEEKRDNQLRLVKTKEEKFNETREYLTNIKSEYIDKINVYINKIVELKIEPDKLTELFKYINEIYLYMN